MKKTQTQKKPTEKVKILKPSKVIETNRRIPKEFPPDEMWLPLRFAQRALSVAATAMCDDMMRPHLRGVSLSIKGRVLTSRATESHWVVEYTQVLPDFWEHDHDVYSFVPAKVVTRILRDAVDLANEAGHEEYRTLEQAQPWESEPPKHTTKWSKRLVHPPALTFDVKRGVCTHDLGSLKIPAKAHEDYKSASTTNTAMIKILSEPEEQPAPNVPRGEFCVDAVFLGKIAKAFRASGHASSSHKIGMKFSSSSKESPIRVSPELSKEDTTIRALVMPMRY